MRVYRYNEWPLVRDEFRRLLPDFRIQDLYDAIVSTFLGRIAISVPALSENLERLYPDEWETKSMCEIIEAHYGKEAVELIESLL